MQYKWTALAITIIGLFMSSLSIRIVVIGLPTIASQLHVGAAEVIWIGQSYLLAQVSLVLLVGRISDLYGRVRLYNIGFILFTASSVLASLAHDGTQLILFRALQGSAAALLTTNSTAIMTDASPRNELGKFLGINQTAFRFGSIAGLTLSGMILSVVDWKGLFYVNVPIGIVGFLLGYKKLREVSTEDPLRGLDWIGSIAFGLGLTSTLLSITFLSYGLSDLYEAAFLLLTGVILIAAFVKRESNIDFAILDLKLFRNRIFAWANIAASLNAITWGIITIILAFYLQIGLGYSPLSAGLAILPLDIVYLIASVVFGNMSDTYGSRTLMSLGLAIAGAGFLAMVVFNGSTPYWQIALVLGVCGLGNGMFSSPNARVIMASVPPNRRGVASGFYSTTFGIGFTASFGLSILLMTLGIPYSVLSSLLEGATSSQVAAVTTLSEFFTSYHIVSGILAIISFIAVFPSALCSSKIRIGSEKAE